MPIDDDFWNWAIEPEPPLVREPDRGEPDREEPNVPFNVDVSRFAESLRLAQEDFRVPEPVWTCRACGENHHPMEPRQCLQCEADELDVMTPVRIARAYDWYVHNGHDEVYLAHEAREAFRILRSWVDNPVLIPEHLRYWTAEDEDEDNDHDGWGPCECPSCRPTSGRRDPNREEAGWIHGYYYKPEPTFLGDGPLYLGMELEVNVPELSRHDAACLATETLGELAYLKHDSTVRGFEIVTEPMSYEVFRERWPRDLLKQLRQEHGASATDGCGLHVHVSRAGFDSPSHRYRWMKLFYRNQEEISALARRDPYEWGRFREHEKRSQKHYAKCAQGVYPPRMPLTRDPNRARLLRAQSYGWEQPERHAAINVTNEDTYEVRVFKSTLNRLTVLADVGLVHGSVEYTRNLSASHILKNDAWSFGKFREWVEQQGPQYKELKREMEVRL